MSDAFVDKNLLPNYSRYPWRHVNSIAQVYRDSPALLTLELTTLSLFSLLLLHAYRHSKLAVLLAAAVSGAINEIVFTNLPIVNNFWHAQAWLMLSPRLPAWQPALYGVFIYIACQSAEALREFGWHGRVSRAAVTSLLAFLMLFPMDAVCVRFVAYTWHDSDPLLADRLLGVAAGNGMFAVAFPFCFSLLVASSRRVGPMLASFLSTPAMVLITLPVDQYIGDGLPGRTSLVALLVAMATIVVVTSVLASPATNSGGGNQQKPADWSMSLAGLVYFSVLLAVALIADPSSQKSVGFHQPLSPIDHCLSDITDLSASGRQRRVYLCASDMSTATKAVMDPTCDPSVAIDQHWYAICGRPFAFAGSGDGSRRSFVIKLTGIAALGLLGLTGCQRGLP